MKAKDLSDKPLLAILRTSTNKQQNSITIQRQKIEAWSFVSGKPVLFLPEFIVEGESGRKERRESIEKAIQLLKEGKISGIIVSKLDRMARSISETVRIVDEINKLSGQLVVLDPQVDTSTVMGKGFFYMSAVLLQMEAEMTAERTQQTMDELKRTGRRASGHIPYGFELDPTSDLRTADGHRLSKYRLVPHEIEIIKRVCKEREIGMSWRKIVERLNNEGVPTKEGKGPWHITPLKTIYARYVRESQEGVYERFGA